MSDLTDLIIAISTTVLACATVALAWFTYQLARTTKEVSNASERFSIQPILTFVNAALERSGGEYFVRVSLKNVGKGAAKNPSLTAIGRDGRAFRVRQHSLGTMMEVNAPFYWDILGGPVDLDIEIAVVFTDVRDNPQDLFRYQFRATE